MVVSVLDNLIYAEKNFSKRIALVDEEKKYTWNETVKKVRKVASGLLKKDESLGNSRCPVPVVMKKSADEIIAFWGIAYIGNFYVPIDEKMPVDRSEKILNALESKYILCDREYYGSFPSIEGITKICIEDLYEQDADFEDIEACRSRIIDTDPVYALFTSGSTGEPKGVVCSHRSVLSYSEWVVERFDFDCDTVLANQTPFYFSMSVLDIYANLKCCGTLKIVPRSMFMQPVKLIGFLNDEEINTIYWVPSALCFLSRLKALDKYEIKTLKKILFAGEVMPTKQLNYWRKKIPQALYANLFGPTEITDIGIYYVVDREFSDDEPIPIGKRCNNVDVLVLDENGKQVAGEDEGELYYRGSFLGLGYYGDYEKTKSKFIQNPLNDKYPEIIYASGDIVRYNEKGELIYVSRKDDQIKYKGNRIELGEIESIISAVDGVAGVCAFLDEKKERIVAAILAEQGFEYKDLLSDIKVSVTDRLPEYMHPGVYYGVDVFPLNANGKIDRKIIKKNYQDEGVR